MIYYRYIRTLVLLASLNMDSIIDIGSGGTDVISHVNCKHKVSLDLEVPLQAEGIKSIKADFLEWEKDQQYDIVCCCQVLEHLEDPTRFAEKLKNTGKILVISVPYNWRVGRCDVHIQDPVDKEKLIGWFNMQPILYKIVNQRLIAVFMIDDELNKKLMEKNKNFLCEFKK